MDYMTRFTERPYLVALEEKTAPDGSSGYAPASSSQQADIPASSPTRRTRRSTVMLDR